MDPNAALAEIRDLTDALQHDPPTDASDAARLAELIAGLDAWLSRGGSLPDAWKKPDVPGWVT